MGRIMAQKRRSFHVSSATQPQITFKTPISAKNINDEVLKDNDPNIKIRNLGFVQVTNNITGKKETLFLRKKKKKKEVFDVNNNDDNGKDIIHAKTFSNVVKNMEINNAIMYDLKDRDNVTITNLKSGNNSAIIDMDKNVEIMMTRSRHLSGTKSKQASSARDIFNLRGKSFKSNKLKPIQVL